MLKRIYRKIYFLLLQSRIKGYRKFTRILPVTEPFENLLAENRNKLRPYYEQYVREISRPDMAASLELATFTYTLCKVNHYKKILDTGSGLSSFVFRLYAKEAGDVLVYSVDDDSVWLRKTSDFLNQHNVSVERMFSFVDFLESEESEFDCILHDLNFVEVRIQYVEAILKRTKQNGLVIFDDVHKQDYLFLLLKKLRNVSMEVFSVKNFTLDQYRRFSIVAKKNDR